MVFSKLFDKWSLRKKFPHEEVETGAWLDSLPGAPNKVKNALNKSPSLRAEFLKFDQIPDNLEFIEALIGLD